MEGRHSARPESAPQAAQPAPRRRGRRVSVPRLILRDLLLTGLLLTVFAFFHHVLPRLTAESYEMPQGQTVAVTPAPRQSPGPARPDGETPPEGGEQTGGEDDPAEPTPEPTPDPSDWRAKFADHFTDEVVKTENSYTSPNIAIQIDRHVTDDGTSYYVADIYVASVENFQTYWANGKFTYYGYENPLSIAVNAGALLSINGDYADNQRSGFLVRNGLLYYEEQTTNDICVLYADGTMETFGPDEYRVSDVMERGPWQVWKFGPKLLDAEGKPLEKYNTTGPVADVNPRSGLGYYEPGHYCFVLVDGRPGGMRIARFAQVFADLGCVCAYNMDGGQSAVMTFDGRIHNKPYLGGRDSGDILLIREIGEEG
ncbi:MAG: phosphodiester glycosidase family protein [Oscillospiraceae bacterium]|nr:phosphodiester glycosidase family protein [Oscillospiraceae bacterium]